jgi:hypothetical protein
MKRVIPFLCLLFLLQSGFVSAQIGVPNLKHMMNSSSYERPSIFYKRSTKWLVSTPIIIEKITFSPDSGNTWLKPGIYAGSLSPYIKKNSKAKTNIFFYRVVRTAGLLQWAGASYFLARAIQYEDPGDPNGRLWANGPANIYGCIGLLYTGMATFFIAPRGLLTNALKNHYNTGKKDPDYMKQSTLYIGPMMNFTGQAGFRIGLVF